MMRKMVLLLGTTVFLIFVSAALIFSQESTVIEPVTPETQTEPEIQWLWGEVVSVDTQKNELLVKYLDYETEEEKEMAVAVDEKTTYENVKAISEIKPKDTVSIDYIVSPEGKNLAQNISVEKPESTESEGTEVPLEETMPEDIQRPEREVEQQ